MQINEKPLKIDVYFATAFAKGSEYVDGIPCAFIWKETILTFATFIDFSSLCSEESVELW